MLPLVGSLLVFLAGGLAQEPSAAAPPVAGADGGSEDYSNIAFADYVGPETCADCHAEKYALWRTHPHSRMNADATPDSVRGDFEDRSVEYAGGRAAFTHEGDDYFMTLTSPDGARRRYRVTRTVGSRVTQMYVGVLVEGPEPPEHRLWEREVKLPFGYWFARRAWLPESYFDTDFPPEYGKRGELVFDVYSPDTRTPWNQNCIFCHNTYPYELRLFPGDNPSEFVKLKGFPWEDLRLVDGAETAGARRTKLQLEPADLVTLGISCESCHFGGREHALEEKEIRFVPTSPELSFPKATPELVEAARESPYVVNSICAQCHSARVNPYPNGSGRWNSREAADLQSGACASAIRCTDCHDPHTPGPAEEGTGEGDAASAAVCVRCHETYAEPEKAAAHSRHGGAVNCLDCHMPRIVQGLTQVLRTHHISSPSDPRMLARAAPNACNLCHPDRSITWTLDALRRGFGVEIEPGENWAKHYGGDLTHPVGSLWLGHKDSVVRLIAADAMSRSTVAKRFLSELLGTLGDRVAVDRMFGLTAVERALGRTLEPWEYEPLAPPPTRARQVVELRRRVFAQAESATPPPPRVGP